MDILMVGVGYVGLVTAACFAETGHNVICLDIDEQRIKNLKKGIIPIYEPGLAEIVTRNIEEGRLSFTTSYAEAVPESEICFIAVPTPSSEDGSCNLSYVLSAAKSIAENMNRPLTVVNKSTGPVGTALKIQAAIAEELQKRGCDIAFELVSNPEFLKEGCAIDDCMRPDRVVLGVESEKAEKVMRELYSSFSFNPGRVIIMDTRSAEMTKYAANAMLALRISFMNELSRLCEKVDANIDHVRVGIGTDQRIGLQFLFPGAGYGGSCFPKDVRALCSTAEQNGMELSILKQVDIVNEQQKHILSQKAHAYFESLGGLQGKTIAIWGLAFKPDTDDMRDAPSLAIIQDLLAQGATLQLYDPIAMPNTQKILSQLSKIAFCKDAYEAAEGADAIILVTEWKQFRCIDFDKISTKMKTKVIFDGRNQYNPKEMSKMGFDYFGIGIPSISKNTSALIHRPNEQLTSPLSS